MTADLTAPIFHDDDAARAHLEAIRWPNGPNCPHCGNADTRKIARLEGKSHRPGLFQCNECREHFTVTVGSVMERSHIPLHKWVLAFHLMNASKKGMSAHQMHRMLGITYKSAWFLVHRIREAMRDAAPSPMGGALIRILHCQLAACDLQDDHCTKTGVDIPITPPSRPATFRSR
jgi:transposase-like protein